MAAQSQPPIAKPRMRPIDEIPEACDLQVCRNAAMTWLRDSNGVEYTLPIWLVAVIDSVWKDGYAECQADFRELLGFVEAEALPTGTPVSQADQQQPAVPAGEASGG